MTSLPFAVLDLFDKRKEAEDKLSRLRGELGGIFYRLYGKTPLELRWRFVQDKVLDALYEKKYIELWIPFEPGIREGLDTFEEVVRKCEDLRETWKEQIRVRVEPRPDQNKVLLCIRAAERENNS